MKNILINIALLVMSMTLVACSSNTQHENTMVGVGSGAVLGGLAGSAIGAGTGRAVAVGVGAVAGALFGGYIGKNMDSSDNSNVNNAMDHNKAYQTTSWNNKNTGVNYKIKPTSTVISYQNYNNCRKFHTIGIFNGQKQHIDGIACRQANGSWQPVTAI